jgi:probable phosphoglycerate mutase
MKRAFLVRHGETDWNREGRFQGKRDIPLNDLGNMQARAAAEALLSASVDRVVSSPLSRAAQTARTTASLLGMGLETHQGLS